MVKSKKKQSVATLEYINPMGDVYIVSRVPQNIVSTVKPLDPKPPRPWISMKTAGGEQKRPMKKGDDGWDEYQESLDEWDTKRKALVDAVTIVLAVGKNLWVDEGNKIPLVEAEADDLEFTEDTKILIDSGLIEVPENIWLLREMWLNDWHFGQHDLIEIQWLIMKLNGTPQEVINNIKDSFQRSVSKETVEELDVGDQSKET